MNGWHRIVAAVIATEVLALVGAAAGAGLLIVAVFYAGGYALHAIELSDPKSLVNQRRAKAANGLATADASPVVIDLRDTLDERTEQPVSFA
jgi:predicted RNA methylase